MPQYMLLIYNPAEGGPSDEEMGAVHARWMQLQQDLQEAGALVFNQGLAGIDAATTVRVRNGETLLTDGPFAETKEYLAGEFLIEADDLDAAVGWAARVPSAEYGCIEVRPVWGG